MLHRIMLKLFDELCLEIKMLACLLFFTSFVFGKCTLDQLYLLSCSIWGPFHAVLFNAVIFVLLYAHTRAVFSDPGVVPLPKVRLDFSDIHMQGNKSPNDPVSQNEVFDDMNLKSSGGDHDFVCKAHIVNICSMPAL